MSIGVAYGSSPPPEEITTSGSKTAFVTTGSTIGTTETTIVVPATAKAFRLHTASGHGTAKLTISNVPAGTGAKTTSWDIKHGNVWEVEGLAASGSITVYIKSNKPATDIQLMYWV